MRQNIAFFDKLGAGEITTRITADTNLIQDGISGKIGLTLTALATFITAFVIGFIKVSYTCYIMLKHLTNSILVMEAHADSFLHGRCHRLGNGWRFFFHY